MKIVCDNCHAEHDLDPPAWVISSGRSFRFRCSTCGNSQTAHPLKGEHSGVRSSEASEDDALYLKQDGKIYLVRDWETLSRWIVEGRVGPQDLISIGGIRWEPVSTRGEVAHLFELSSGEDDSTESQELAESTGPHIFDEILGGEVPFAPTEPSTQPIRHPSEKDSEGVPLGLPTLPPLGSSTPGDEATLTRPSLDTDSEVPPESDPPTTSDEDTYDDLLLAHSTHEEEPEEEIDEFTTIPPLTPPPAPNHDDLPTEERETEERDPQKAPLPEDATTLLDLRAIREDELSEEPETPPTPREDELSEEPETPTPREDELSDSFFGDDDQETWPPPSARHRSRTALIVTGILTIAAAAFLLRPVVLPSSDIPSPPSVEDPSEDPTEQSPREPTTLPAVDSAEPTDTAEPSDTGDSTASLDTGETSAMSSEDEPEPDLHADQGPSPSLPPPEPSRTTTPSAPTPTLSRPAPRPDEAPAPHKSTPSVPRTDVNTFVDRGWEALDRGDVEEAKKSFSSALEQQRDHPGANFGFGYVLVQQQQTERATKFLCRAVANANRDQETLREASAVLEEQGLACP